MVRIGDQLPANSFVPLFHSSLGEDAVNLAALANVHLDEWQQNVLKASLNFDKNGKFTSQDVCLIVPRQNGKGEVILARELAGLFLLPKEKLIVHSAHEFKTSVEGWQRLVNTIRGCDYMMEEGDPHWTNSGAGGTVVKLRAKDYRVDGEDKRVAFSARSKGAIRGFTVDCLLMDEAYELPDAALDAMTPTQTAVDNPQMWFVSSTGMDDSVVLRRVREAGMLQAPNMAYFEWKSDDGCNPLDPDQWYKANPSLGIRIEESFLASQAAKMSPEGFGREHLGLWADNEIEAVIPSALWRSLIDPDSKIDGRMAFAVDVTPDYKLAAVYAAGQNKHGLYQVQVAGVDEGVHWLPEFLLSMQQKYNPKSIAIDPGSPAGVIIPELNSRGVRFKAMTAQDVYTACGQFETLAKGDKSGTRLRHFDDMDLESAVRGGIRKLIGNKGAWVWQKRDESVDICYLIAATNALYAFTAYEDEKPRGGRVW